MLFLRRIALLTASFFMLSGGALGCHARQPANSQTDTPAPVNEKEQPKQSELKVLAEGSQSAITSPFVAVVRDADTYAALTKLDGNLPNLDADSFKTSVVVAAFLGERNTGGYSIEITRDASGIRVLEKKPGKDMMVTQMITSPFKIVAVAGASNSPVWLALDDDAWQTRMTLFRVTTAKFTMVGGIAGIREEFSLGGAIGVLRAGNLATLQFRLIAPATTKRRALTEYATGIVSDNNIRVSRMSADSLINPPSAGLQADGTFSDGGKKLWLNLISRPSMIADGYSGRGSIDAAVTGSANNP